MPTMTELRSRTAALFTDLLATPAAVPPAAAPPAAAPPADATPERTFSWFDPDDDADAVALAAHLAVVSGAAGGAEGGLEQALDLAEVRAAELPTELVAQDAVPAGGVLLECGAGRRAPVSWVRLDELLRRCRPLPRHP